MEQKGNSSQALPIYRGLLRSSNEKISGSENSLFIFFNGYSLIKQIESRKAFKGDIHWIRSTHILVLSNKEKVLSFLHKKIYDEPVSQTIPHQHLREL